ncbi:helix-turn-helix domain-containing protein [Sediminitomix flava]|uniref:AraC family transcriptional regulator n=1 Tax=Sediminitomix flava TaxID=379075 RepID=A0A315Z9U4_SEDFL|nr:helix-turn-helix transcriptional regulator [Sediminitomix flava]PWJ42301.1 AraC family transcriptional regulator [Sediminitomix flava]
MLDVKDKIERNQLLKVEAFRKNVRVTKAHKHNNYFELVLLTKGSGFHTIDEEQIDIQTPIAFCIQKDQSHFWDMDSEPEGFVLILRNDFLLESNDKPLIDFFYQLSEQSHLHLKSSETISLIFEALIQECSHDFLNYFVIEGLLKALFSKLIQNLTSLNKKDQGALNAKHNNLYQSFLGILNQDLNVDRNVAFYADKLNTSPQNLNAICRKHENKSAKEVISFFMIKEAKRLLRYTNETVSEIAFHLGFKDPSHFVKYFKRSEEVTPKAFRELNR